MNYFLLVTKYDFWLILLRNFSYIIVILFLHISYFQSGVSGENVLGSASLWLRAVTCGSLPLKWMFHVSIILFYLSKIFKQYFFFYFSDNTLSSQSKNVRHYFGFYSSKTRRVTFYFYLNKKMSILLNTDS